MRKQPTLTKLDDLLGHNHSVQLKKEIRLAKQINEHRHRYSPAMLKALRVDYFLSLEKPA
jgi:hypothetical protein